MLQLVRRNRARKIEENCLLRVWVSVGENCRYSILGILPHICWIFSTTVQYKKNSLFLGLSQISFFNGLNKYFPCIRTYKCRYDYLPRNALTFPNFWQSKIVESYAMYKFHNFYFVGMFPMFDTPEESGSFLKGKNFIFHMYPASLL